MRVTLPQVEIRAYPVSLKGEAASRVLLVGLGYFPSLLLIDSLKIGEGGNLAASKIRNLECPNYEICLIDY
ncbi:hypothetical protein AAH033_20535, partial [Phocaeicola vulgatus]